MSKRITTGFLTGNVAAYLGRDLTRDEELDLRDAIRDAIKAEYPDADVTVMSQNAEGSLPRPLQTAVIDGDDYDCPEDVERVDRIMDGASESFLAQLPE